MMNQQTNPTMTMTTLLAAVISLFGLQACGRPTPHQSSTRSIVGANDLQPVSTDLANLPENLRPLADAIGLFGIGCTGTHIGDGIVVTAGHCFQNLLIHENSVAIDGVSCRNFEPKNTDIGWGFRSLNPEGENVFTSVSHCVEVIHAEWNGQKDYAIVRVDQAPTASIPMDFATHISMNQEITLLSHPNGRPLEWSQTCRTTSPEIVSSLNPDTRFIYTCDTEPGSSGAAVIDMNTRHIIGIHNGGTIDDKGEPWNYATFSDVMSNPQSI